ncbi:RpiB/LacA/LacB family sugar-phosphate isomerase [Lacticaseibacillus baoqingensis]|uniref:RpiB/LacA/LacB family sugar-phosphate isomerase n=1 Tax=Lacticaseibacillus baoqingensis TaxID=2486013 RepID=A0ABW4E5S4_9LACO|nr:RpiB/LacA/LacB family sugar-phosphate isomerase [Lacticaseibacillus baoqingensis]
MKIALLNEFSQAPKNDLIFKTLKDTVTPLGHEVYNAAMSKPLLDDDVPEAYTANNPRLTYLHLGIQAALLLNSHAVDFIIAGCGTGQGALMSLNAYPGVVCGYCIEPADAYLYLQINDGNALSIPFAKGFGWGAEVNLHNIFQSAFSSPSGLGYPKDRKESQNRNAKLLMDVKQRIARPLLEALDNLDESMVKEALTPNFMKCFNAGCKDKDIGAYVAHLAAK